jgi:GNAT superfamily N-acetyltransferase
MIPVKADPASLRVTVVPTGPEHAEALDALQRLVFPTLDSSELFTAEKYRRHIALFPDGQFTALVTTPDGETHVVGATTTYRTHFDFAHIQHTYIEATAGGWLSNHDPEGEWMYGIDVSVHPAYRGLRIGRRLYDARREAARRLNLRGEIAGALLPHYEQHSDRLSIAQYILQVYQGRLHDPTLSMQIKNGFVPRGVLYDHISDPRSFNAAALIVRENPHYAPPAAAVEMQPIEHAHDPAASHPAASHPAAAGKTTEREAALPGRSHAEKPPPDDEFTRAIAGARHHHGRAHSQPALRRAEAAHIAAHPHQGQPTPRFRPMPRPQPRRGTRSGL